MPESSVWLLVDFEEGVLIGTADRGQVDENGTLELSTTLPNPYEGIFQIEVVFKPEDQDENNKDYYDQKLEGNFVRNYTDTEESLLKASFQATASTEKDEKITIQEPVWDIPDDYGDVNIRIEPNVTKNDDYIIIGLDSNLLEGT